MNSLNINTRKSLSISLTVTGAILNISQAGWNRTGTLNMEAQIIYSMGGPQPVARQTFYLLDTDLKEIPRLKENSLKAEDKASVETFASLVALLYLAQGGGGQQNLEKKGTMEVFLKSKPLWESNIIRSVQTDFKGQAAFEGLKPGDYWLVGIAETRMSVALWNHKVTVKAGENKVLLDQNNALYSK